VQCGHDHRHVSNWISKAWATGFSLPDDEADKLIEAGHKRLRQSPEFKKLLATTRDQEKNNVKPEIYRYITGRISKNRSPDSIPALNRQVKSTRWSRSTCSSFAGSHAN